LAFFWGSDRIWIQIKQDTERGKEMVAKVTSQKEKAYEVISLMIGENAETHKITVEQAYGRLAYILENGHQKFIKPEIVWNIMEEMTNAAETGSAE